MMISPLNSRDLRTEVPMPRVPHAIRAEYSDAADDYAVAHVIVYREGFDAGSATLIETVNYQGFTTTATAAARARFDLKVAELRNRRYLRELGHDYHLLARGSLVGLTDDTLDLAQAYGIIRQMTSSAGNYVAITLDTIIPFEAGQDDLRTVGDAAALTDILNLAQPMGVAIRLDSGAALVKPVVEVTASNTVTFAVPFADDGSLHPGQIVACGVAGREFRRCRVIAIAPEGIDSATVTLIDECPEIFA